MSVSSILGAHGAPLTLEHAGRVYTARANVQKVRSCFERWLKARVRQTVVEFKDVLPAADFQALLHATSRDIASDRYAFGGAVCEEALGTVPGAIAFASIIFSCTEDEMAVLMQERGDEVKLILDTIIAESTPRGNPGAPGEK